MTIMPIIKTLSLGPSAAQGSQQSTYASNTSSCITGSNSISYSPLGVNPQGTITHNAISSTSGKILLKGDCEVSGDLTVDGVSIRDQLNKINERLAILVPDPEMLEKYAALRNLYDQYKALEALCK